MADSLTIRINRQQREELEDMAKESGKKVTAFVRDAALGRDTSKDTSGETVAFRITAKQRSALERGAEAAEVSLSCYIKAILFASEDVLRKADSMAVELGISKGALLKCVANNAVPE